jgi:hypothetical protein
MIRGEEMMKTIVEALTVFALIFFIPLFCHADSAQVLPKGVFSFDSTYYHYFDINDRYDPDGDVEDIDVDYNANLDSTVFPALAALDPFVPGGIASIGNSVVDFTLIYRWFEFAFSYGLTDKLSIGVLIPYNFSKNEVDAHLDPSTANVGKNVPANSLLPLIVPGTVPLTDEDVQDLLGAGLDINGDGTIDIPGFGYERVETWSDDGIGDIELLGKYQFYNKGAWRLAFTGGVRLPTGEIDDPDNLQDLAFGDDQTDIIFRFYFDYIGIEKLLLNATLRYDLQLPDEEERRVLDDVNQPLTINKEDVDRDLGDIIEIELLGNYSFTPQWSAGLKYRFTKKFEDDVDGDLGFVYSSLEKETDVTSHMAFVTVGYSTIQMYLDKKFSVPISASITYRNRFAGENNATKSQYISLNLAVFF